MSSRAPSFAKITLAVAAGIVLAFTLIHIVLQRKRNADVQKAVATFEAAAAPARAAKTMDQVVTKVQECKRLEAEFRATWGRDAY